MKNSIINNKNYKTNLTKFKITKINNIYKFLLILIFSLIITFLIFFITDNGFDLTNAYLIYADGTLWTIILASICLVVSSFIVQTLTNNKMADTSILGIGSINLVFLVIMVSGINISSEKSFNDFFIMLPFVFLVGSILGSLIIFGLTSKNKYQITKKFILAGILMNFTFAAIATSVSGVLTSSKQNIISSYNTGNIDKLRSDFHLYFSIVVTLICLIWFYSILKKYKIVTTNNIIANQLGINIKSIYWQSIIISSILTSIGFLLVGNVVFLGLIGANISLFLFKKDFKYSVISSGMIGYIILGTTFFFNKNIVPVSPVNTSSMIPLIATPYFMYLLLKKN